MKKIYLILFLLCFSITNTAYAETEFGLIDTCFSKANGPEIVSASNIDFAVQVVLNIKHYTDKIHPKGLVAFVNCKHNDINRCEPKWTWRSSEKVPMR